MWEKPRSLAGSYYNNKYRPFIQTIQRSDHRCAKRRADANNRRLIFHGEKQREERNGSRSSHTRRSGITKIPQKIVCKSEKRKREDLNQIGYENVRSFFFVIGKKMSSAKEKEERENVWFADLWWWSRPSGGRCSTTPGGKGDGTRVIQFKLQSDRDKDDRTLAVGVSMVSFKFFCRCQNDLIPPEWNENDKRYFFKVCPLRVCWWSKKQNNKTDSKQLNSSNWVTNE